MKVIPETYLMKVIPETRHIVPSVFSNKNVDIKISAHDAFLE
jgi:hypothetical protein